MKLAEFENTLVVAMNRALQYQADEVFIKYNMNTCNSILAVVYGGVEYEESLELDPLIYASIDSVKNYIAVILEKMVLKIEGTPK